MKVKLSEIADCLEMTMQNWEQYYNKKKVNLLRFPIVTEMKKTKCLPKK